MAVDIGTAIAYLNLDSTNFNSNLQAAQTALQGMVDGTNSMGDNLQAIGGMASRAGSSLIRNLTVPIVGAAKEVIQFGADFDKSMSNVKAVTQATDEEFEALRNAAIQWGEKTVYTASEASEALYYMGLAGWNTNESVAALGDVLALAAAGNLDLGRASDIVTDAMTAMGLSATETTNGISNASYFTSVLAAVMANANTDVDKLGESFKYVAPVAGSLGYTIEDLGLALGLAANNGIKSSQAGTSLRQALKNLISPSKTTAVAMAKYNVSLFDSQGNAKDLRTFMEELRVTFGDLDVDIMNTDGTLKEGEQIMEEYGNSLPITQQEKLQAITNLFGTRALPTMLAIVNAGQDDFYGLAASIDEAAATGQYAYDMAETQLDNLEGDWTRFTSALGTLKIELMDLVSGPLREFVQHLTELVKAFNSLDDSTKMMIIKIAMFAAALGPILLIGGRILSGIGTIMNIIGTLGGAIGGLISGPMVAIIAVLAIVAIAIADLWENNEEFRNNIIQLWDKIKETIQRVWTSLKPVFEALWDAFKQIIKAIEPLIAILVDILTPIISDILGFIADLIEVLAPVLVPIIKLIADVLKIIIDIVATLLEFLKPIFSILWDIAKLVLEPMIGAMKVVIEIIKVILEVLAAVADYIARNFTDALKQFKKFWDDTWRGISEAFHAFVDPIVDSVKWVVEKVVGFFEWLKYVLIGDPIVIDLVQGIYKVFKEGFDLIYKIVEWLVNNIVDFFKWLVEKAIAIVKGFAEAFLNAFEGIGDAIQKLFNWIKDIVITFGGDLIQSAIDIGKGFINGILGAAKNTAEFFTDFMKTAIRVIIGFVDKFREAGFEIFSNFWEGIKSAWEKIKEWFGNIWDWFEEKFGWITETIKKVKEFAGGISDTIFGGVKKLVNGSHANGLDYVPYDGYIAELHKGERVLTSDENKSYNSGGNTTININSPKQVDPYEASRIMKQTMKEIDLGLY